MKSFLALLQVNVSARSPNEKNQARSTRAVLQNGARFLYGNIVFILFVALVCVFFSSLLLALGLILIALIFFVRWFALSSPFPATRINLILLVLLLAVLWSMLRAPEGDETVLTVAHILGGIAVLYVIVDYADHPGRLWYVAAVLVASGIGIALAAPFITEPSADKLVDATFLFQPTRFNLEMSSPNLVAVVLAALLPLALALGLSGRKRMQIVGAVALAPLFMMLLLLQARGAWFAALGGVLIYLSLHKRGLVAFVPLTIFLFVLLNAFSEEIRAALPFRVNSLQFTPSLQGRREIWNFAATQIVREPLGNGINSFKSYADNLASDRLSEPQRPNAHNLFLQVGFETGFIGLGAFAALSAYAFYASWHAVSRKVKRELAIGVFTALCAAFLNGLLEANMWGNKAALWLWALFGMAVVLGRYGARRRRTRRGESLAQAVAEK